MTEQRALSSPELFVAYQTIAGRRAGYDAMLWQTPALGVTAQAFLLTLALGAGTTSAARLLAASLSLVLSLMTMQLMAKHRYHESLDSLLLERFEDKLGLSDWLEVRPHGLGDHRLHADDLGKIPRSMRPSWFWGRSSYRLWLLGLALFGAASLVIIALVLAGVANRTLGGS